MSAAPVGSTQMLSQDEAAGLIASGQYSRSLRDILSAAAAQPDTPEMATKGSSASVSTEERWSLLGVLHAAGRTRVDASGAAAVFNRHARFLTFMSKEDVLEHTLSRSHGTSEVGTALRDAAEIRKTTGGKDNFIGLRHALFSILLPPEPSMFEDLYELLAAGGTLPTALARSIAEFCQQNMEKEEKAEAWESLISERLPKLEALPITVAAGLQVATPGADDPWAEGKVDRSGAQLEAEAFASMICWSDFTPPLAVGVFGDWGKGKSFFMRLVHDAIEARSRDQDGFLDHVVQIRFNAWHYAETNLWASLVDHILSELDAWAERTRTAKSSEQVFARLDTARDWTLVAAEDLIARRKAKAKAEDELAKANTKLADRKKALSDDPDAWRKGVWDEVLTDNLVPAYKDSVKTLGLTEQSTENVEDLRRAVALYNPDTGGAVAQDWWRFLGNHMGWASLLVLALFLLPMGLAALMNFAVGSGIGGAVAGAIAPIVAAMAVVSRTLKTAHGKLAAAHAKVQKRIDEKTADEARKRAEAEAELAAAELAMEAAEETLRHTESALRAAEEEYEAETGKGRILKFVRDRVTSGDYRKQLSFIAQIRRDFDELSVLMNDKPAPKENEERRAQHEKRVKTLIDNAGLLLTPDEIKGLKATYEPPTPNAEGPVFERIVLYIDDLDRCPADQVVVVLQAIHLLLAYPLFVVFVAVDVRWLQQALEAEYDHFKDGDAQGAEHANASDYLEKIFQVPYWVRAMSPENTSDLLTDLMAVSAQNAAGPDAVAGAGDAGASVPGADAEQGASATRAQSVTPTGTSKADAASVEPPSPVRLEFTSKEAEFVRALSEGLDGSPRRTLRFVNSYRLIKASLAPAELRGLTEGGYRSILALLAVQICSDEIDQEGTAPVDCFRALTAQIAAANAKPLEWARDLPESDAQKRMVAVLDTYKSGGGQVSDLAEHVSIVARYSFSHP